MIARPKIMEWHERDELRTIPSERGSLVIECSLSDPPSMRGRTCYVVLMGDELAMLVRAAREAAIRQREQPMVQT